jgi:hypothetical protein
VPLDIQLNVVVQVGEGLIQKEDTWFQEKGAD